MTPLVDDRGHLFGRINLFDATVVLFAFLLIPIGYGTALLFRTPAVRIDSVTPVPITREERRVAGGSRLSAKLKVHGSGLRPMLRASIGDAAAIGFVFENPNSADVLVGEVPAGANDLILFDGVQEVARSARAVVIPSRPPARLRAVGTFLNLDKPTADGLRVGGQTPDEIIQLGPPSVDRRTTSAGATPLDAAADRWRRSAVVVLQCDPDPDNEPCTIGGRSLAGSPAPVFTLAGPSSTPVSFRVDEVLPFSAPSSVIARVRIAGAPELLDLMKTGDREALLDERAAIVVDLRDRRAAANGVSTIDVVLRLGVDESEEGWRYRGRAIKAGAPFSLTTDRYVVSGVVLSLTPGADDRRAPPR